MRPNLNKIAKPIQNINQYGFTENMSYLLGALQRHEVEMFCLDNNKTFMSVTLDGVSAFDVVSICIQTRELFCVNEEGKYWLSNHYEYENSKTRIKMNSQLSDTIDESLGVKRG